MGRAWEVYTCLVALTLFALQSPVLCTDLLIFGDSIDRFIVIDWCHSRGLGNNALRLPVQMSGWGDGSIKYYNKNNGFIIPAMRCVDPNYGDSISFVHTFGAASPGPYHMGIHGVPSDPFIDTEPRIERVFELYLKEMGKYPSRILFHTGQWEVPDPYRDMRDDPLRDEHYNSSDAATTLKEFRSNTLARINQIRKHLQQRNVNSEILMRTAAWERSGGQILHHINVIIRDIAFSGNLSLFDMEHFAWAMEDFDYSRQAELFRDRIHPREFIASAAGQVLLGNRYTAYYHYSGNPSIGDNSSCPAGKKMTSQVDWKSPEHWQSSYSGLFNCNNYDIRLLLVAASVNITSPTTGELRLMIDHIVNKKQNGTGSDSMATATATATTKLSTSELMSAAYYSEVVNGTRFRWSNPPPDFIKRHHLTLGDILWVRSEDEIKDIQHKGRVDFFYTPYPAFSDGELIRFHESKSVYYVDGGAKRLIPNGGIFFSHGWDFEKVRVVYEREKFDYFPTGPDVT